MQELLDTLECTSDYPERRKAIAAYQTERAVSFKRGLALTPVTFGIYVTTSFLNQAARSLMCTRDARSISITAAQRGGRGCS